VIGQFGVRGLSGPQAASSSSAVEYESTHGFSVGGGGSVLPWTTAAKDMPAAVIYLENNILPGRFFAVFCNFLCRTSSFNWQKPQQVDESIRQGKVETLEADFLFVVLGTP